MKIPANIKKVINKKVVQFATSDKKGKPNLICVFGCEVVKDQIVITDNYMNKTKKNLKQNNKVSLCVPSGRNHYQLKGTATYFNAGKWLDFVKNLKVNKNFKPKGAIIIRVKEIYKL